MAQGHVSIPAVLISLAAGHGPGGRITALASIYVDTCTPDRWLRHGGTHDPYTACRQPSLSHRRTFTHFDVFGVLPRDLRPVQLHRRREHLVVRAPEALAYSHMPHIGSPGHAAQHANCTQGPCQTHHSSGVKMTSRIISLLLKPPILAVSLIDPKTYCLTASDLAQSAGVPS